MLGNFTFVLHTHLPYVLGHGKWPHGSDWLMEAVAECYIPLLQELERLEIQHIPFRLSMDFTPVLLEQLADLRFPELFTAYCNERIDLAEKDYDYFFRTKEFELRPLALWWHDFYTNAKRAFEQYDGDLVGTFRRHSKSGALDAMTSGATHGYFPLLLRDENIRAQIRIGVETHEKHFGKKPRGIWLPECGYRPRYAWRPPAGLEQYRAQTEERAGIEELISECGLEYFVAEGTLTKGGVAVSTRYQQFESHLEHLHTLEEWQRCRIEYEVRQDRSLADIYGVKSTIGNLAGTIPVVFSRDRRTSEQVWSGRIGYPGDPAYLEFHKKHHHSGLRYWRITSAQSDLGAKQLYEPEKASEQARTHARHFVSLVKETLRDHQAATGREGIVCSPFDTELFGHWWFEGTQFLCTVFKELHNDRDVRLTNCAEYLNEHTPREVIALPEGSWGDGGGHYVWMNKGVAWMWDTIYPLQERFLSILRLQKQAEHAGPFLRHTLEQAARELLLMEASDWQFIITTRGATDYATERFHAHVLNLRLLLDLAERLLNTIEPDAEDHKLVAETNHADPLFVHIDLNYWL